VRTTNRSFLPVSSGAEAPAAPIAAAASPSSRGQRVEGWPEPARPFREIRRDQKTLVLRHSEDSANARRNAQIGGQCALFLSAYRVVSVMLRMVLDV